MSYRPEPPPPPDTPLDLGASLQTDSRTEFEVVTDVLLPLALFGMLGALVWFLLDVRAVLVAGPTQLLRFVFFFFLIAVVGIARIKAREGGFNAAGYGLALLAAMGLFGFRFAFGGGRFGSGFGGSNPVTAVLTNYAIIAFIWIAGHFIVERTTIDPEADNVQAGMLTSEEWEQSGTRSAAVRHRPHPGKTVMYFSLFAVVVFGLGHRVLAGHPREQHHAFWCMVVYLGCALGVLAMSALCGLQLYVRHRGTRLPPAVVWLWLVLAYPLGLAILGLAQVAPKLEPVPNGFTPDLPPAVDRLVTKVKDSWVEGFNRAEDPNSAHRGSGEGTGDAGEGPQTPGRRGSGQGDRGPSGGQQGGQQAGQQTGQGNAAGGQSGRGQGGQGGEGGGDQESAEQSPPTGDQQSGEGQSQGDQQSGQSQSQGDQQSNSQGDDQSQSQSSDGQAESDQQQAGEGEQSQTPQTPPEQPDNLPTPPPEPPQAPALGGLTQVVKILAIIAGVALLLFALYRVLSALLPGLRGRLAGWLQGLRGRLPRRGQAGPTRDPFVNPFGPRSPLRGQPPVEYVRHVYRAFQAYCALIGCPRSPDLTAHEFLCELPPSVEPWRREITELTDMYAAAEYTPDSVDEGCLTDLRVIWDRLIAAVREVRD